LQGASNQFEDDLYYDYVDNRIEEEKEIVEAPTFLTSPLVVTLNQGNTLRLPCSLNNLQGFVLLWKRGNTTIAIGTTIVVEVSVNESIGSPLMLDFNETCLGPLKLERKY
jgi:hypothetical protein